MRPVLRSLAVFALLPLLAAASAQTSNVSQKAGVPRQPKPPALVDPAGPAISLETSEALFDVGVALNACGFDSGLSKSDPVRQQVRDAFNQEAAASADLRSVRDEVCRGIDQHRLFETARDESQYISLALYLTPPPALELSVDKQDLPPDATQVVDLLPILQQFIAKADLHLLWLRFHPEYEAQTNKLHDTLTRMVLETNLYLKLPLSTYTNSRFLVVLEPLLDPSQVNARVYGSNYVVVASPVAGVVNMKDIRHAYLHYELEPLLYQRANSMERMLPFLKIVHDAPLEWEYRSDIVSLVTECMIRAVEARTMDTGVPIFKIPANAPRADLPRLTHQHQLTEQKDAAVRQATVTKDMQQGFVLTQYFYTSLQHFETTPESLKEAIGPMVYGMDLDQVEHQAKEITFVQQQVPTEVVRTPVTDMNLNRAEAALKAGNADEATKLAMQSLKEHASDPARANYILALAWLEKGDMDSAVNDLHQALQQTNDPRLLAWSHIFLGRIDDVRDDRPAALTEYQAAMQVRDGQPDTLQAAEHGLKQPYALPGSQQPAQPGDAAQPQQ